MTTMNGSFGCWCVVEELHGFNVFVMHGGTRSGELWKTTTLGFDCRREPEAAVSRIHCCGFVCGAWAELVLWWV